MFRSPLILCLGLFASVAWSTDPQNEQRFQLPDQAQIRTWSEGNRDFYEIRQGQTVFRSQADYTLHLRGSSVDPLDSLPRPLFQSLESGPNQNLYIVQFETQILPGYLEGLKQLGAEPRYFLPNYAQVVFMAPDVLAKVSQLEYVRWVGPFHPAFRLEEFLLENADQAEAAYPIGKYNIMILGSDDLHKNSIADRIKKIGGQVDRANAGKYLVEATLRYSELFQVVGWDDVLFIDRWSEMEADVDKAREIGGANYIETVAGYTGQGVRGEVLDLGFNLTHVDFASRPLIEHTPVNSDSHGAACSGIIFGDGTGNPAARGMIPDAQGIVADWDVISTGTPRYNHTGELAQAPYFAVFQSASVGNDRTTQYTNISADTDAALFDFDVLHCQSQSNAGDQMSRPQAWAKNVLSGGAVNHQDTLTRSDDCWCSGASIGPATDGRIKPDLSSFYDATLTTTTGSNTSYTPSFGGTSGATPIICGHAGLVFQMWADGIFGNEVTPGATVFENRCHMTTAKALMINTAYRYEFSGTSHDMTRTHQGWGMPDLQRLYDLREQMIVVDETDLLLPLDTNSYTAHVVENTPAFNATMIYADPPGNPAASVHRINNVDLRVTSPSGVVYWGNNGLRDGNWSIPDGSANTVDTVECVFVQNPEVGAWLVEVIGAEINQDSHVETGSLDADYSLVISGALAAPGFKLNADEVDVSVCRPGSISFEVDLSQQLGFSESVTLSASGAAGAQVSFSANPIVPPATVTVTVNTTNMTAGQYGLLLTGTSTSLIESLNIGLTVSSQIPLAPENMVPANGASEVSSTPTYRWDAVNQASSYIFERATDSDFAQVVETATVTGTSYVGQRLAELSCFFWRVRANNACGDSLWSAGGFTTQAQPNYFTELFTTNADLDNTRLSFVPDGSGSYYEACRDSISSLPTNPAGGTILALTDDSFLPIIPSHSANLYGTAYSTIYVGSNGYLTFVSGDDGTTESLLSHFQLPRISLAFDDLNPANGSVTYRELGDRIAISWVNVPEYNATTTNTFQAELFHNGEIHLSWLGMALSDSLAGLSRGTGVPADFLTTDLSATDLCGGAFNRTTGGCSLTECEGDLDGSGEIDQADATLLYPSWLESGTPGDLNGDGTVNLLDMVHLLTLFGACP